MELVALALGLLIGVSLGLLGGGGSILTLPILTYVAGVETKAAIAGSLFVVGVTSVVGMIAHARARRIRWRAGLGVGTAGMIGAFAGGRLAAYVPADVLVTIFAVMMFAAGAAMWRGRPTARRRELTATRLAAVGAAVGVVTGMIGAGGGFIIVPVLVLIGGIPMELAVGTSLVVIAMQSFAGLAGHLAHTRVDWPITVAVTGAAVLGGVIGAWLVGRIPRDALRRGFAGFVVAIAALVLAARLGMP